MEQDIRFCKTSDGVRIAYATSGAGPPLVRVLGWFTHLEYEWENPLWRSGIDAARLRQPDVGVVCTTQVNEVRLSVSIEVAGQPGTGLQSVARPGAEARHRRCCWGRRRRRRCCSGRCRR